MKFSISQCIKKKRRPANKNNEILSTVIQKITMKENGNREGAKRDLRTQRLKTSESNAQVVMMTKTTEKKCLVTGSHIGSDIMKNADWTKSLMLHVER